MNKTDKNRAALGDFRERIDVHFSGSSQPSSDTNDQGRLLALGGVLEVSGGTVGFHSDQKGYCCYLVGGSQGCQMPCKVEDSY